MKRLTALLLSLALMLPAVPTISAASSEAMNAAQALYEQGLFSGTGINANGDPDFALDRAPTRNEAVTMLVRLLGKADEAINGTWNIPFTDVVDWAKPYVGYAYANGLTSGTSATTYGGEQSVTAAQYITFILRALGYEAGTDFQWDKAWELSDKIGLTDGRYNAATTTFTRGDVAVISYQSLSVAPHTQPDNSSNEDNVSVGREAIQGLWSGINRTASGEITEIYQFDGTSYNCAAIMSDQNDNIMALLYEEGTFEIYDSTIKLVCSKQYTYRGNGTQTQVSQEMKTLEYTIRLSGDVLTLNNWVYKYLGNDSATEGAAGELYETIKSRVMEHLNAVNTEPSSTDYGYLAAADFRTIRLRYSTAAALCGYAYEYTDLNGDHCVLTIVYYKILDIHNAIFLHNLTQNRSIEDPADYYNRQADRAYGANKLHYMDLSSEVSVHVQEMLKAMVDVMQTGNNTGDGVYVGPEILNQ